MLLHGDCLDKLKALDDNSIDSIVTDPPYGLSFMDKIWDYQVPSIEIWKECLRVLKPGGHVLSFGGTRTYHRMVVNIEDAGFEIRDQVQWIYGSGFPKSHNLKGEHEGFGTALKPANEPICLARKPLIGTVASNVQEFGTGALNIDASRIGTETRTVKSRASNEDAMKTMGTFQPWDGDYKETQGRWPANILLDESAAELLDEQSGNRPGMPKTKNRKGASRKGFNLGNITDDASVSPGYGDLGGASRFFYVAKASKRERNAGLEKNEPIWEIDTWEKQDLKSAQADALQLAKVTSDDCLAEKCSWNIDGFGCNITEQSLTALTSITSTVLKLTIELKTSNAFQSSTTRESIQDAIKMIEANGLSLAESVELTSQSLLNTTNEKTASVLGVVLAQLKTLSTIRSFAKTGNFHSTVKPIKLMEYLVRMITPPNGVCLDPFMGSGTTGIAAKNLGFKFIGIEREAEYVAIAEKRIAHSTERQLELA